MSESSTESDGVDLSVDLSGYTVDTSVDTILLIGKDAGYARRVRDALVNAQAQHYRVYHASDLRNGLDWVVNGGVDLVLLDISASDGAGLDTLREILAMDPGMPVVVLSVLDDETVAARAVRDGAQDYLVKSRINGSVIARVARYAMERNRVLARFRNLDQLKSELVSTVSHEMRTPLAIVREFVSLVRDGVTGPVNADQDDCLESALRNCDRMATLIDGLLDLSRIESGKLKLWRRRADLEALLRQCHADFLPRCRQRQQTLSLKVPPSLPPALGDRDRVLQVLVNLIGNAHKFAGDGGHIEVRAEACGNLVRIEVADDGMGISAEDQERIFDSFTQVDRAEGPGFQGTGLGLAISRNIIHLHGGRLTLQSDLGDGCRFAFTLPRYTDGDELGAFVEDGLRVHKARKTTASFVLMRVPDTGETAAWDDSTTVELLAQVECLAHESLRNSRDGVLLVPSRLQLAMLLESTRDGSRQPLGRLGRALEAAGGDPAHIECAVTEVRPGQSIAELVNPKGMRFRSLARLCEASPEGKRILIVDDEPMVLRLIANVLGAALLGTEIVTTTSGFEACVKLGELKPDLVILDLQMPDVDGRDVLISMRKFRKQTTRFLAVSGFPERFPEMMAAGCDDCLSKPFDGQVLIDKVSRLIGGTLTPTPRRPSSPCPNSDPEGRTSKPVT